MFFFVEATVFYKVSFVSSVFCLNYFMSQLYLLSVMD